jgi:hypothetical protein
MMGKYSAEWWEKIAGNREISAGHNPSSVIDDLIQATASGKPSPARKRKTSRSEFDGFETALSEPSRVK